MHMPQGDNATRPSADTLSSASPLCFNHALVAILLSYNLPITHLTLPDVNG
jgi:hypothetical protein